MKPEWVVLFVGVAFLLGAGLGIASAALYVQWEQKLSKDEARWRRIDWQNRLDDDGEVCNRVGIPRGVGGVLRGDDRLVRARRAPTDRGVSDASVPAVLRARRRGGVVSTLAKAASAWRKQSRSRRRDAIAFFIDEAKQSERWAAVDEFGERARHLADAKALKAAIAVLRAAQGRRR